MLQISLNEAISQGYCRILGADGWSNTSHPAVNGGAMKSVAVDKPLTLRCPPELYGLRLLRHPWSGDVLISWPDGSQTVPLTAEVQDHDLIFKLPDGRSNDIEITLQSVPQEGRDLSHSEVWLLDLAFTAVPRPTSKSMLLNTRTRLLYADWGEFLVLSSDKIIPDAIVEHGSWAPNDIAQFEKYVRPGDFVLDVGANFGHHTIVFSKLVGDSGLVMAIEAQKKMYQLVHANAALNGRTNIIVLHAAAGADHGSVTLYPVSYDHEENFGALGINTENPDLWVDRGGEEVKLYPLDELVEEHATGRRLSFVKVDVQAYELFVLQGLVKTLNRDKPTLFVEISPVWMQKAGYDYREIYRLLHDIGYTFIHARDLPFDENGIPDVPNDQDIEWDLLAVHRDNI